MRVTVGATDGRLLVGPLRTEKNFDCRPLYWRLMGAVLGAPGTGRAPQL